MSSKVTDFLPIEIKFKPYYVHAKQSYLQHRLLIAAKVGQDVYENEYNKLNNMSYDLKENNHISIQEIFRDNWDDFKAYCASIIKPNRHITWTIDSSLRDYFQRYKGLYNELFEAVNYVLTYLIQDKSKSSRKRNERLGFISTIHT